MKVTFNGITLAEGGYANGTTWAAVFNIAVEQRVQTWQPLRAEWLKLKARGGRSHVITLTLRPPPEEDHHEAFAALSIYFADLPAEGALVLESGGNERTYEEAVLVSMPGTQRNGTANAFQLVFRAGEPSALVRFILDGDGVILEDGDGVPLEW